MKKKCNNCNITKDLKDFKSNWYSKKWTKLYKPQCKYCMNLYLKNYYKDRIVIERWKPVIIANEKRLEKIKHKQNRYQKNKERINAKEKARYHSKSPKEKRKTQIRQTRLAKKRREEKRLQLIAEKRAKI